MTTGPSIPREEILAIACPSCRREYDVTLFQLGRTLHCTCGARVGLEHRLTIAASDPQPRFMADAMLGGLARWLRTLGYDTAFDAAISDEALVRRSLGESRRILTRDRKLLEEWRVEGTLVTGDTTVDQLGEVVRRFGLPRPRRLFTRCRACNAELERVELASVRNRVPEDVAARLEAETGGDPTLTRCPDCRRVYWEGSHTERMRAVVDDVFDEG